MKTLTVDLEARAVVGLEEADQATFRELVIRLNRHRIKNETRRSYYEGHNLLKDLGIAVPPQLRSLEVVVGWPAKAVDAMSRRTILDGFTTAGSDELDDLMSGVWEGNFLAGESSAAHTSALVYSCAFIFVTVGGPGEPEALITTRGAEDATGIWDARRRTLSAALSVIEYDKSSGRPTALNMYVPNKVIAIVWNGTLGLYEVGSVVTHSMGVPVEVIAYRPTHDRPFGRSRITRGVRYLTDASARTMLRSEVGAEFYNAPQRYVLGADDDAFTDPSGKPLPTWSVMLGRMLALSTNDEGDIPTVGQFAQQTMQPNVDQLRSLAQMFAAETSLPVSALGIVQDNPASAEAIRASNEELGIEIEHWERTTLGPAWKRAARRAVGMITDSPTALAQIDKIEPHWGSWVLVSEASIADAAVKQASAVPDLANSPVLLRRMGFSPNEIEELVADRRKAEASSRVAQLVEAAKGMRTSDVDTPPGDEELTAANVLKAKADALGVLRRAGVDADDAARLAGLPDVKFIPGQPITIKTAEEA